VTPTSAAPAATTPTAAASSSATFPLRTCLIYYQRTTEKILPVEGGDGFFGFGIVVDFDKTEPARLTRKTIAKQRERIGLHANFREQCLHLLFRSLERQISHVQFLHGRSPCAFNLRQGTSSEAEEAGIRPRAVSNAPATPG
jgi:hypothetical protein